VTSSETTGPAPKAFPSWFLKIPLRQGPHTPGSARAGPPAGDADPLLLERQTGRAGASCSLLLLWSKRERRNARLECYEYNRYNYSAGRG
jgi:hypothetical protein